MLLGLRLTNCLSLLAPMPIASGSLKPANPKLIPILLQLAFVFLFPLVLAVSARRVFERVDFNSGGCQACWRRRERKESEVRSQEPE